MLRQLQLIFTLIVLAVESVTPAAARGTYHHSEPYVVHPDKHKTHSWAPVIVYSPEHHHYHLTYHLH